MSVRKGVLGLFSSGLRFPGYTPAWVAGQVGLAAALGALASGAINLFLAPGGLYLSHWQLWPLLTAALLARWFGRPVREPPPAAEVTPEAVDEHYRPYPIAERWARRLSVTSEDPEWFGRVARDRLAALVAERLRQRHGLRLSDPAAATLLGDELYAFLTEPLARTPTPAELGRHITRMERI